ncbi:winged helix-turn-helix transcriptional regulator [Candidatus Gracilibacteria bacterium]|nr:winged helix-turn-helix transcriptional regulator [Candidatus Gracilibacteria bacterium]
MNKEIMYMNSRKIKLDFSSRKIFVDDDALILRNKLFELFVCFVKHSGMVVTRTQLLEEVWDRNICWPTNTLDVHVAMLRKKLGKRLGYDVIRTVHCIGYIFEIGKTIKQQTILARYSTPFFGYNSKMFL